MPDSAIRRVTCFAPAKINLTLHVTGQRADGYHALESLVAFCDIGDQLTMTVADGQGGVRLSGFSGTFGEALRAEDDNLILRAARAFLQSRSNGDTLGAIDFQLDKNLPVASGIGGGSADAAAALLCLWRAFGGVSPDALTMIAAGLGADVPMCLYSSPLIARGIGEDIELLDDFPDLDMVLVNPMKAVATPQVFARLAHRQNPPLAPLPGRLTLPVLADWLAGQCNDLQGATSSLVHEISEIIDILQTSGAMLARMSGSGATCFGLYADTNAAQTAAAAISSAHPGWWVKAARSRVFGIDRCRRI